MKFRSLKRQVTPSADTFAIVDRSDFSALEAHSALMHECQQRTNDDADPQNRKVDLTDRRNEAANWFQDGLAQLRQQASARRIAARGDEHDQPVHQQGEEVDQREEEQEE